MTLKKWAEKSWTVKLGETPCYGKGLMNLALFFCPVVRPPFRNLRSQSWLVSFFWFFCIKLDSHKVRKATKPNFWKNVLTGRDGSKSRQNGLKMRFLEFWQKSNPIICPFLREYESNYDGPTSLQKSHVWKKCGSWVRTPKQSEYLLNYNVSQTSFVFD